jgi:DNA primase
MARIPDDELERLKREVSIERLVEARGVELKRMGKDLRGRCPFHDDEDPSFSVDPVRNVFHCFGCGAKGSVIDLVMHLEGVTFRHAVEILRADYPTAHPPGAQARPPKKATTLKLPALVEEDDEISDSELRGVVAGYYHETFKQCVEPQEYMESRGLRSAEMVERFKLGYSNRTLGYRMPQRNRKNGKEIRGRLAELGIIKESGHELMRGSVVVPIFNGHGRVVQMYGRKIRSDLRKGTPMHLYLPGPRRGVWNLEALAASKEIILCEALIDALTLWAHGFRNVTTAYGINGFNDEHLQAFKAYGTQRVLIAYDRDERGEAAAAKLAERLMSEGLECFRVELPHGMDVNEFALKVTPAAKSLAMVIRSAKWLGAGRSPGRPSTRPVDLPLSVVGCQLSDRPPASAEGSGPRAQGSDPPARPASEPPGKPMESRQITEPEPSPSLAAISEPKTAVKAQEIAASAAPAPPEPTTENRQPTTIEPASPLPAAPGVDIPTQVKATGVYITLGDRVYRVRGLTKNMAYDVLKINLMVSSSEHVHVDSFNLYSSRQRGIFASQAALELAVKESVIKGDLRNVLLKLEELQEQQIRRALEPEDKTVHLNDSERAEALAFLQDPELLDRISADFETCGLVGEHTNKLVGYLAAVSRKLERPLGVLVQSSSAAGKSALMEAVLAFMPEEERVQYSAMTGQSLFYMGETDLQNKILAIAEEEGAERASYALKLLQSEGRLSIASTGKDPSTGKLVTHEYHVEGPAAILLTTTAIDLDEELQNRCIVLAVDESREQTEAIHRMQRQDRTLAGLERRLSRSGLFKLHQNAQRLLRPLYVVNSFSPGLTFLSTTTRTRRDHLKYLILIESIALLRQHQRKVQRGVLRGREVDYIEVLIDDIAVANRLASEVLGRTLDELPPQTRRLLLLIHEMVAAECKRRKIEPKSYRFTRRQVREHTGWSMTQLRVHVERLVDMEYLITHRGGRGQTFVYELLYDGEGQQGEPFVLGLINVDKLRDKAKARDYDSNLAGSDDNLAGSEPDLTGPKRVQNAPKTGGVRGDPSSPAKEDNQDSEVNEPENAHLDTLQKDQSYPHKHRRTLVAVGGSAPLDDDPEEDG